jgi:hypothetical protein
VIQVIGTSMAFAIVQQLEQQQALRRHPTARCTQHLSEPVFDKSVWIR